MNNIYSFAKVIVAAIGIFFAIRIVTSLAAAVAFVIADSSVKMSGIAMISVGIGGVCLAAVCYLFLYKRQQLAIKIVGTDKLPEPDSQLKWLPVAFKLISIAAGLYCLHTVLWQVTNTLIRYGMYKARSVAGYKIIYTVPTLSIEKALVWLIMLTMGIYLACGAPHFIRWHVRKTLEQCKQQPEMNK